MFSSVTRRIVIVAASQIAAAVALAQPAPLAPREVPAKTIPVPNTVSSELQQRVSYDIVNLMDEDEVRRHAAVPVIVCRNVFI